MPTEPIRVDVVILGGGIAGLWTLDAARMAGLNAVLLEARALGYGQTLASQGIIHGGLKYTLSGLLNPSAQAIRDMPALWRRCLAGEQQPDLSRGGGERPPLRASFCHLWRTDSLASRAAMIGAKVGLRVAPTDVPDSERPAALRGVPGVVARLDEQVIDVPGVLAALAERNPGRVLAAPRAVVSAASAGVRVLLDAEHPDAGVLCARRLVLAAGAGNAGLRASLGLDPGAMQRRPLHQVLVRGACLPELNGHCVDGAETRVTITTARDAEGRTVWQVGGRLAERGVNQSEEALIGTAQRELASCLPGVDFSGCAWSAQRIDRAEGRVALGPTAGAVRPDDAAVLDEGAVISVWPTKLALAPRAADMVVERLSVGVERWADPVPTWESAPVGVAPWDEPDRVWRV